MNNMLLRAISGTVYIVLIVACSLLGDWWFFGLTLLFALLAVSELNKLLSIRAAYTFSARLCDLLAAGLMFAGAYGAVTGLQAMTACLFILPLYIPARMAAAIASHDLSAARSAIYSGFSIVYTCVPLLLLFIAYAAFDMGMQVVLSTFIIIWTNDTGAYLSGRAFGKHKLCERLSPKKTMEGFYGGLLLSIVAACICCAVIYSDASFVTYVFWAVYGAVVSLLSTVGDLFESLIKRRLDVKDSGNLIPGHGGILDRIDSLLAVAPATIAFMYFAHLQF